MKIRWTGRVLVVAGLLIITQADGEEVPRGVKSGEEKMTESSNSKKGWGAAPPLTYQIAVAESIVLCATEIVKGAVSYRVREVWKSAASSFKTGESLRLDTAMHELLGYRPRDRAGVVLFFTRDGLPSGAPVEVLPVVYGGIIYSPHDRSVREELALDKLKERVIGENMAATEVIPEQGMTIPLGISFIGLKAAADNCPGP